MGARTRRILVTGHLGYVGAAVVPHLRRAFPDAFLAGADAGWFEDCLTGSEAPERCLDLDLRCDVRSLDPALLEGVDAVVHLAAVSNDPIGNAFEAVTYEVNEFAAVQTARLAREAGVRSFVFASSCSVYGRAEAVASERSLVEPLTAYARSKVGAEEELARLAGDGFEVTSLRFATACGASDRLRLDLVLNDFVASAVASGEIRLLSDGSAWRPLIHVRDMARAIEWAIERDGGGVFLAVNAGSDSWNYRIRDLAETVARLVPGSHVVVAPGAQPDRRSYRVSFERFRDLAPRHQPRLDLETTVLELRDSLGAMGFADRDFRRSRYIRLVALEHLRREGRLTDALVWMSPEAVQPAAASAGS
jgi:nucleoside-diphosphate-sugar epimerase